MTEINYRKFLNEWENLKKNACSPHPTHPCHPAVLYKAYFTLFTPMEVAIVHFVLYFDNLISINIEIITFWTDMI